MSENEMTLFKNMIVTELNNALTNTYATKSIGFLDQLSDHIVEMMVLLDIVYDKPDTVKIAYNTPAFNSAVVNSTADACRVTFNVMKN